MIKHVEQERNVGLDSFDGGLGKSPYGFSPGIFKCPAESRYLYQQAVVERRDFRAFVAVSAVETYSKACRAVIVFNHSGVRHEVVHRVFCGDPALDGVACHPDGILIWNGDFRRIKAVSLGDEYLILNDIHSCNDFGNSVFYLNSRVHLYEVMVSVFIHQEFHCSCASVVYSSGNLKRIAAYGLSLLVCEAEGRREFDNFLVSSLYGTVSLIQMNYIAVLVSQYLHLDVLRIFKILFYEYIVDAESFFGFASGASELRKEFFFVMYDSHSSAAAACSCLEHYRIAAFFSKFDGFLFGGYGFFNARNRRHAYGIGNDL